MNTAGRRILNEILNSDYRDLTEKIDQNPQASNELGMCGESPAHISIYKKEPQMLMILLASGTNPNLRNSKGDSLLHSSARLGMIDCIKMLYETGRCLLEVHNDHGQTALDISRCPVQESDLSVTKSFKTIKSGELEDEEKMRIIAEGRLLCADYLVKCIQHEREGKVQKMIRDTTEGMKMRHKLARTLRGVGERNHTAFYADISYPRDINSKEWGKDEVEFFSNFHEGIDTAVIETRASDYVNNSLQVGVGIELVRKNAAHNFANKGYPN